MARTKQPEVKTSAFPAAQGTTTKKKEQPGVSNVFQDITVPVDQSNQHHVLSEQHLSIPEPAEKICADLAMQDTTATKWLLKSARSVPKITTVWLELQSPHLARKVRFLLLTPAQRMTVNQPLRVAGLDTT